MRNAKVRKCPKCDCDVCGHDERLLADALSAQGTGVMNIDLSGAHRWVMSLRRYGRTSFVELKRHGERMGEGQEMALRDLTGHQKPLDGGEFEQRAFIVVREMFKVHVYTLSERVNPTPVPLRQWGLLATVTEMEEVAAIVGRWLRTGVLSWDRRDVGAS